MKINKYISLDDDLFYKLQKENNASNIINELVKEHYNIKNIENIEILEQNLYKIKQIIKENRKKSKELSLKISKIKQKNREFFDIFKKSYPEELIKKLKKIENLDYDTAHALALEFDLHRRGVGGIKLIKVWEEIKKDVVQT
jgi:plasmid maintenance system antidote protein VapI